MTLLANYTIQPFLVLKAFSNFFKADNCGEILVYQSEDGLTNIAEHIAHVYEGRYE